MLMRCKLKATHPAMLPYSHGWHVARPLCVPVFQCSCNHHVKWWTSECQEDFLPPNHFGAQNPKTWILARMNRNHLRTTWCFTMFLPFLNKFMIILIRNISQIFETTSTSTAIHCHPLLSTSIPSMISIQDAHGLIDPIPLGHLAPSVPSRPPRQPQRPRRRISHVGSSLEGGALHGGGACFQVQTVHGHHLRAWIWPGMAGISWWWSKKAYLKHILSIS